MPATNEFWLEPKLVRAAFNRASPHYDAASAVIAELRNRLLARLDLVRLAPARVLDLGAGTGVGTRALKDRYPKAQVIALDSAQSMLQQARVGWFRKFERVCADAAALPLADETFDLVFSHLMLPWCNLLDVVFAETARVLRRGGLFLFCSLGPDTGRELRQLWRELDDAVHVHGFIDMHDVGDALLRNGFADPVMDVEYVTVTYPTLAQLAHEARQLGATNLAAGRPRGLTSRAKAQRLRTRYDELRRDNRLPVTLEVVYGHAWISEQRGRRTEPQEVRIPLNRVGRRQ